MIQLFAESETGQCRTHNEDRVWIAPDRRLAMVLDGCGGYGKIADVAIAETSQSIPLATNDLGAFVKEIGARVYEHARTDPKLRGTGTTLDLLIFGEDELHVAHVGDGRILLAREGELQQLSTDHTLVAEMVARGEITQVQASGHFHRNVITRAVGVSEQLDPEVFRQALLPGDIVIACTDGLWKALDPARIIELILASERPGTARALIQAAESGGDNVSVLIAFVS